MKFPMYIYKMLICFGHTSRMSKVKIIEFKFLVGEEIKISSAHCSIANKTIVISNNVSCNYNVTVEVIIIIMLIDIFYETRLNKKGV